MDRAALSRIAEACRLGIEIDVSDRVDLALALESWLSGQHPNMDKAFGVARRRGQRGNRTMAASRARDELLRSCADLHFGGLSLRGKAAAIVSESSRYSSSAWRADRHNEQMPASYTGTPREAFWRILAAGASIPGQRRLISILTDCEAS